MRTAGRCAAALIAAIGLFPALAGCTVSHGPGGGIGAAPASSGSTAGGSPAAVPADGTTQGAPSGVPWSGPPGPSDTTPTGAPPPLPATITVEGRVVPAAGVWDVAAAIRAAGAPVPDGRLLAISGRVLDAHADPATILVDGALARPTTPLRAGDAVTFRPGRDRVEGTRTETVPVYLDAGAAALYVHYRPGTRRVVTGAVSGEVIESTLLTAPQVGRLRARASFALTFDDGPNPDATPQVMALLARFHAPAVFCLIGANALAHPDLPRQEVAAGFRLCDHTQTHPESLPQLSPAQIAAEIRTGLESILHTDGNVAPRYFRAPGGNWSAAVEAAARALHLIPLRWTVDPRDWSRPGTEQIITTVLDQLRPGGTVLLHDGGGDRTETVAALARLLPELTAAGWQPAYPGAVG